VNARDNFSTFDGRLDGSEQLRTGWTAVQLSRVVQSGAAVVCLYVFARPAEDFVALGQDNHVTGNSVWRRSKLLQSDSCTTCVRVACVYGIPLCV